MAYKMKASPAKRGAIQGAGPNSPMKMASLLRYLPKAVNTVKNIFKGSTKLKQGTNATNVTIKEYAKRTTPRYHPQTGKLVNPPPYPPTNLNQAAEKLNKSAKYYGN